MVDVCRRLYTDIRDRVALHDKEPTWQTIYDDSRPIAERMSPEGRALLERRWENHPVFGDNPNHPGGSDGFEVAQAIRMDAAQDQGRYQSLLARVGPIPPLSPRGRTTPRLSREHREMKEILTRWQGSIPNGAPFESVDQLQLTQNRYLLERNIEDGFTFVRHDDPQGWLNRAARLIPDFNRAYAQRTLHPILSFRYLTMNWTTNPLYVAIESPRAGLTALLGSDVRVALDRATEGKFSPLTSILRARGFGKTMTSPESWAHEIGARIPRGVRSAEVGAPREYQRGIYRFLRDVGVRAPTAERISRPYDVKAAINIATEDTQRANVWEYFSREAVRDEWERLGEPTLVGLQRHGFTSDTIRQLDTDLGSMPSARQLYQGVMNAGIGQGLSEAQAGKAARQAYDAWVGPSLRAGYDVARERMRGAMPIGRIRNIDEWVSAFAPFTFWHSRMSKYLLKSALEKPYLAAAWSRYDDWADKWLEEHPDTPPFMRGMIEITRTPLGLAIWANPRSLLLTSLFAHDEAAKIGFDPSWWDEFGARATDLTGITSWPSLDLAMQLLGQSRDPFVANPLSNADSRVLGRAWEWIITQAGWDLPHPNGRVAVNWLVEHGSGMAARLGIPGAEQLVPQQVPEWDRLDQMILQTLSEEQPDLSPGEAEQLVADISGNPDDPRHRAARKRLATANLAFEGVRAIAPLGFRQDIPAARRASYVAGAAGRVPGEPLPPGEQPPPTTAPTRDQVIAAASPKPPSGNPEQDVWNGLWANHLTGGPSPNVTAMDAIADAFALTNVLGGTDEYKRLVAADRAYREVGTPRERQVYQDYVAIAHGRPGDTLLTDIKIIAPDGNVVSIDPETLAAMGEFDRQQIADLWVGQMGFRDDLDSFRAKRDQAKTTDPAYAEYLGWRDYADSFASPSDFRTQESQRNPAFAAYVQEIEARVASGEIDAAAADAMTLSPRAYLAYFGRPADERDAAPAGGETGKLTAADVYGIVQGANAPDTIAEQVKADIISYTQDGQRVAAILGPDWETMVSGPYGDLYRSGLAQQGVKVPSLSNTSQAYVIWVTTVPKNGDHSPEAFAAAVSENPGLVAQLVPPKITAPSFGETAGGGNYLGSAATPSPGSPRFGDFARGVPTSVGVFGPAAR